MTQIPLHVSGPQCHVCGSPWFEPEHGELVCCDCGAPFKSRQSGAKMTRSRASAKAAGSRAERAVADYLATELDDDRIDRRVKHGAKDRGDIGGLRIHGQRLVVEVKDCARLELPAWTKEADTEAGNDDALVGVVVHKRRGTTDVGKWWVAMTADDLLALIDGQRHGHRKDGAA